MTASNHKGIASEIKIILAIIIPALLAGFVTPAAAEYKPWNYNMFEIALYHGENGANSGGKSTSDTYLELEGFHRYKLLDLYWFHDFFDILNSSGSDLHNLKPSFYGEINPRISLDGLTGLDLSFWRFTEWFISYQFDYDNGDYKGGLQRHQIGLGTYLKLEHCDYIRLNLFARYAAKSYGKPNEDKWDGYLLNIAYSIPLYESNPDWSIDYSGWSDIVFGARESRRYENSWNDTSGTSYSLQWYNQLELKVKKHFAVSISVKLNDKFTEVSGNSSSATQYIVGIHLIY